MIKPIIRKKETKKDKQFSAIFNWEKATLYSDAVKARLLGYKSMHFQIGDEHMNYYVEGELFNKFATGMEDMETIEYVLWCALKLYEAKYSEKYTAIENQEEWLTEFEKTIGWEYSFI